MAKKKGAAKKARPLMTKKMFKPSAKKAKAARTPKKWTSGRGAERAAEARKTTAVPKQPPLIKGVRIAALDKVFENIADTRAAMNRLRGEEADYERHAHRLMREHKKNTWSWAGVEASRIPGEEKLRIRTSRETSTASNDDGDQQQPEPKEIDGAGDQQLQKAADELEDAIEDAASDGDDDNPFGDD
jgi:hypothetical protein